MNSTYENALFYFYSSNAQVIAAFLALGSIYSLEKSKELKEYISGLLLKFKIYASSKDNLPHRIEVHGILKNMHKIDELVNEADLSQVADQKKREIVKSLRDDIVFGYNIIVKSKKLLLCSLISGIISIIISLYFIMDVALKNINIYFALTLVSITSLVSIGSMGCSIYISLKTNKINYLEI